MAAADEGGRAFFVLAMVDGRAQIVDGAFEAAGSIAGWGSDLAGTEARCGGGAQILATKAGDLRETDAVRAYGIANRTAVALSPPLELPGPVTALWSLGGQCRAGGGARPGVGQVSGIPDHGGLRWVGARRGEFRGTALTFAGTVAGATRPQHGGTLRVETRQKIMVDCGG